MTIQWIGAARSIPSRTNTPRQPHPRAVVGLLVEAQCEAPGLCYRHDSFINEADGRDQPVDLKPQAREVRSKATGLLGGEARLDLRRPIDCDQGGFRVCLPLDVFQRGYGAGEPVDVGRLSNRVATTMSVGIASEPFDLMRR